MNSVENTDSANDNITSNTVGITTSITTSTNQQIFNGQAITFATTFEFLTDNQIGLLGYAKPYQSISNILIIMLQKLIIHQVHMFQRMLI